MDAFLSNLLSRQVDGGRSARRPPNLQDEAEGNSFDFKISSDLSLLLNHLSVDLLKSVADRFSKVYANSSPANPVTVVNEENTNATTSYKLKSTLPINPTGSCSNS